MACSDPKCDLCAKFRRHPALVRSDRELAEHIKKYGISMPMQRTN